MSVFATAWANQQRAGGPRVKQVLSLLADFADEEGLSWPSIATLARISEQSRSSVERCLVKLADQGLVRCEPRFDGSGRRTSNAYYLLAPAETLRGKDKLARPVKPKAPVVTPAPTVPEAAGGIRQIDVGPPQADGVVPLTGDVGPRQGEGGPTSTVRGADVPSRNHQLTTKNEKERPVTVVDWWERFWTIYPHPQGDPTKPAHEAWTEAIEGGIDPAEIVAAARAYDAGKPRWQSSVQACRWLREGRWTDWRLHRARSSPSAPAEPQFAFEVSEEDRAWFRDRWRRLQQAVGDMPFRMWCGKLTVLELRADLIRFAAPSRLVHDYVITNLNTEVGRALGRGFEIEVSNVRAAS